MSLPKGLTPVALTLGAALIVRVCFITSLSVLQALTIPELVTPITSYKALLEAQFLGRLGVDTYDNSLIHHLPLLVAAFGLVALGGAWAVSAAYVAADLAIGWYLIKVNRLYHARRTTQALGAARVADHIVAAIYLFNPLTLLSLFSRSTVVFSNLAIVAGFFHVLNGDLVHSLFLVAVAGCLDLYSFLLAIPFASVYGGFKRMTPLTYLGLFAVVVAQLLSLSYAANGFSWSFMPSTFGTIATLAHLTPNVGLWWYFFTEMFDFFTPFYHGVFNLFLASFVTPITLRFHGYPAINLMTLTMVHTVTTLAKSYPSWGDLVLVFALIPILTPFHAHFKYAVVSGVVFLAAVILLPVNYYLWFLGSGNSNFFYAINLVLGVALSLLIGDMAASGVAVAYRIDTNHSGKVAQI